MINDINTATGGKVTASLATTGSGIVLTDSSGGGGTLAVTPLNHSNAAADLGLNVAASGQHVDRNGCRGPDLGGNLRQSPGADEQPEIGNQQAITAAGQGIQTDINRVIELHGQTGAYEQQLTQPANRPSAAEHRRRSRCCRN